MSTEITDLQDLQQKADQLFDEFHRIKACPDVTEEIKGLCDRAMQGIRSNIPVIDQREKANERISEQAHEILTLRSRLAASEQRVEQLADERDEAVREAKEAYQKGLDASLETNQQLLKDAHFYRSESQTAISVLKSNTAKLHLAEQQNERLRGVLTETDNVLFEAGEAAEAACHGATGIVKSCETRISEWKARRDNALSQSPDGVKGRTDGEIRAAFEEWAVEVHHQNVARDHDGDYVEDDTHDLWEIFRMGAQAASTSQPAGEGDKA